MAIFSITETTEVAIVGMIGDGFSRDWLGVVMRDAPDQPWYLRFRFRYYDGGDVHDPDAPDTKNVFEVKPKDQATATRDQLVQSLRGMVAALKEKGFGTDVELREVNGGGALFADKMKGSKFMHSWKRDEDAPRTPSKFNV